MTIPDTTDTALRADLPQHAWDLREVRLSDLTHLADIRYAVASGEDLRFDLYQPRLKPLGSGPNVRGCPPDQPTPVVVWVPEWGIEDFRRSEPSFFATSNTPCPISSYIGYGFTVVSATYASAASRDKDLALLVAHLRENARRYHIDARRIGILHADAASYDAAVLGEGTDEAQTLLSVERGEDPDFRHLMARELRQAFVTTLCAHVGGRYLDEWDPITMPTPEVAWIDPCTHTSPLGRYRTFRTPRRGPGSHGSYAVYLPPAYDAEPDRRFPVVYYLHGGGGNQREAANWLMTRAHALISTGDLAPLIVVSVQGLPVGWFTNGNPGAAGVLAGPVEDVVVQDLVPHIDATYRTIADRAARGLEGFSAGGYGALRLAFGHPETFGWASSLAGAVIDFDEEPNPAFLGHTFGPPEDPRTRAVFEEHHPLHLARRNLDTIRRLGVGVRLVVGDEDWLFANPRDEGRRITERVSGRLHELGIPNEYRVITGVDHMITHAFDEGRAPYPAGFWIDAFRSYA